MKPIIDKFEKIVYLDHRPDYDIDNIGRNYPDAFNGMVFYKKYKITVELIPESDFVYAERLKELLKSSNIHTREAVRKVAKNADINIT